MSRIQPRLESHANFDHAVFNEDGESVGYVSKISGEWVAYDAVGKIWHDGTARMKTRIGSARSLCQLYENELTLDTIARLASRAGRNRTS